MTRYRTKSKPKAKPKRTFLPLWLSLAGLVLVAIAIWALTNSSGQSEANIEVKNQPRLKVEQNVIDRGNIKLGTTIRDYIRVTNIGDQPLRFAEAPYIEVKEGC